MEKYGVEDRSLVEGLRDEEHQLMLKLMDSGSEMEKESSETQVLEKRLAHVRNKITDIDLGRNKI